MQSSVARSTIGEVAVCPNVLDARDSNAKTWAAEGLRTKVSNGCCLKATPSSSQKAVVELYKSKDKENVCPGERSSTGSLSVSLMDELKDLREYMGRVRARTLEMVKDLQTISNGDPGKTVRPHPCPVDPPPTAAVEKLQAALRAATEESAVKSDIIKDLKTQAHAAAEERAAMSSQIEKLKAKLLAAQEDKASLVGAEQRAAHRLLSTCNEMEELKAKLCGLAKEKLDLFNQVRTMNLKLLHNEDERVILTGLEEQSRTELYFARKEVKELHTTLRDTVFKLRSEKSELQGQMLQLECQLACAVKGKAVALADVEKLKAELVKAAGQLEEVKAERLRVDEDKKILQSKLAADVLEKAAMTEAAEKLGTDLEVATSQTKKVQSDLAMANGELKKVQAEYVVAKEQVGELESSLATAKDDMEKLQDELDSCAQGEICYLSEGNRAAGGCPEGQQAGCQPKGGD